MAHYSRLNKIVIDVPAESHERELDFWQAATGQPMPRYDQYPEYHGTALPGQDTGLLIQALEEGTARVHVDIHTDDVAAEVARLERLGARRERQVHAWWVLRDPAGLPFCVIPAPPGELTDGNAQRWE